MSSKWSWFGVVLAAIRLSVITDAQPTIDETESWEDGYDTWQEAAKQMKKEMDLLRDEITELKRNQAHCQCVAVDRTTTRPTQYVTVDPSKQALISALVCESLACLILVSEFN